MPSQRDFSRPLLIFKADIFGSCPGIRRRGLSRCVFGRHVPEEKSENPQRHGVTGMLHSGDFPGAIVVIATDGQLRSGTAWWGDSPSCVAAVSVSQIWRPDQAENRDPFRFCRLS